MVEHGYRGYRVGLLGILPALDSVGSEMVATLLG